MSTVHRSNFTHKLWSPKWGAQSPRFPVQCQTYESSLSRPVICVYFWRSTIYTKYQYVCVCVCVCERESWNIWKELATECPKKKQIFYLDFFSVILHSPRRSTKKKGFQIESFPLLDNWWPISVKGAISNVCLGLSLCL